MSNLRNKVQLIGYVGNAPEVVQLESGKKVANFTMATNDSYRNANGDKVEDTQWHNLVVWGKLTDVVEKHVKKGKELVVQGKLTTRSYDDKEGNKKYITEIIINELLFVGAKKE